MNVHLPTALSVLERTPAVLDALLRDLPDGWTAVNEGGESWTAFDNVGHLVSGELHDWMARLRIILAQAPDRRFAPFNRTAMLERDRGVLLPALLDRFAELRRANLVELRALNLTDAQLRLTGEHPAFGTVTAGQLLATWVVHDLGHIAQIARVMARQYTAAVGPWIEYLPVLTR
jgi:hypothetical protein